MSPPEPAAVVLDLLREIESELGVHLPDADPGLADTGALEMMARAVAPLEATLSPHRPRRTSAERPTGTRRHPAPSGALELDCSDAGLTEALLLTGWASPEAWGTWTDGHEAALWLPLTGRWPELANPAGRPAVRAREDDARVAPAHRFL